MTCIVAVADPNGSVVIGGDSAGTDAWDLSLQIGTEPKVWRQGHLLFGACGSFRVSQLVRYHLTLPVPDEDVDPLDYLSGKLVNALRDTLAEGGALTSLWGDMTEELTGSGLIVCMGGRVFAIQEDFGVLEMTHGYAAIGCGALLAWGALAATEDIEITSKRRVRIALDAAERHSAGVRGPMTILRQPPVKGTA